MSLSINLEWSERFELPKIIALQATALTIRANFTFSSIVFSLTQEQYGMTLGYYHEIKNKLAEWTGFEPVEAVLGTSPP